MSTDCYEHDDMETLEELMCWTLGQLAQPFDPPKLIRTILTDIRNQTNSLRADLLIYQSDMNILFFSETVENESGIPGMGSINIADTKNSAPVKALSGGHTIVVDDVTDSGVQAQAPGAITILSVPLIYNKSVHGVFNLEHGESNAYDAKTVMLIEAAAGIISTLLEHSYLTEQLFRLNQRLIDQMTQEMGGSDPGYRAHAERVASIAVAIAGKLDLEPETVNAVRESGYLHDIGKSGVKENILVKPGKLTEEEFSEVKKHPVLGRFLLKPLGFHPLVIEGVASHHERWDGEGYPRGLEGSKIPITGRILAVAEAYDVMTSDQPYREKMSHEDAIRDIQNNAGSQFDPDVVDAFLKVDPAGL